MRAQELIMHTFFLQVCTDITSRGLDTRTVGKVRAIFLFKLLIFVKQKIVTMNFRYSM